MLAFTLLCLVLAVAYSMYWLLHARYQVYTDNAYVQGNVVQVTPLASGTVVAVNVQDTDQVQAGQVLVSLDPVDSRLALDQAEAQLAQTVRDTRALYATNKALAALISARQADVQRVESERARLKNDLARRLDLQEMGAVAVEEVQHLRTALSNADAQHAAALAALSEAREQLNKNQVQTAGVEVHAHPRVRAAAASYREAWLNHQRRDILAPLDGAIARRNVQLGQRLNAGTTIMTIVPLNELWVDANFKESQLKQLRVGQRVRLTADVYGSQQEYHGRVAGLAAGTGAAFSLLPAQNATGNWIKIVQRLPVRIQLDPAELAAAPLRIGLSMQAHIDVRETDTEAAPGASSMPSLATMPSMTGQTAVYAELEQSADAQVKAIIAANLGMPAEVAPEVAPEAAPDAARHTAE